MATTENTYTGNNSTTDYSFTFPYLKTTDIKASLAGTDTTAFTLANATTVRFNTAPGNNVAIRLYRVTSADDLAATFYAGSAIKSTDLNDNFTQNLYVTQEAAKDVATANTTANTAKTTADTASTNASTAVSTANTASTNATNAVSTANTASTNATNAVSTANTASTNASNAVTTANAAEAAVAAAVLYSPKATVAAWVAGTYTEDDYIEVQDSTGIQAYNSGTTPKLTGLPSSFQGATGLTVRLQYTHSSTTFAYKSYFANDSEERYMPNPRPFLAGTPGKTYTVKVAAKDSFHRYNGTGSSNGFTIDGEQAPFLEFTPGITYRFDQADSSNANHTLKFYEEADKTTEYTSGVTTNGTPGQAGAYTQLVASDTLPTVLHYMSSEQASEGNGIQTNTAFDRTALPVIDGGDFTLTASSATVTTTYDGGAFT